MQSQNITEVTQDNIRPLLEKSVECPVLFYFWAPMSQESAQLLDPLKALMANYQGACELALLNCQTERNIAMQFGVQALPTFALFAQGQPIDGLSGPQSIENIKAMLDKHVPSQDEMTAQQALQFIQEGKQSEALPLLTGLPDDLKATGEIKLALADCYLATDQFELAEAQLSHIPLEYQDGYYKSLMAKLELHQEASNSPEITALETHYQADKENAALAKELAAKYHDVGRNEDALELLWYFLKRDLNTLDGEMKKVFMDILSAIGQNNSLAKQYRRQLYSLLY